MKKRVPAANFLSFVPTHYRKYCTLHEVQFGDTLTMPCALGEMKLYALPADWGADGPELAGAVLTGLNVKWVDLNNGDVVYGIRENGMERIFR